MVVLSTVQENEFLYSFGLTSPPGQKKHNQPKVKLLETISKSVIPHISFYIEDDDHKKVNFISEQIFFTCKLKKNIIKKRT